MMNLDGYTAAPIQPDDLTLEDRWMLSRLVNGHRDRHGKTRRVITTPKRRVSCMILPGTIFAVSMWRC